MMKRLNNSKFKSKSLKTGKENSTTLRIKGQTTRCG
jgi:hypothetical protein